MDTNNEIGDSVLLVPDHGDDSRSSDARPISFGKKNEKSNGKERKGKAQAKNVRRTTKLMIRHVGKSCDTGDAVA